MESGRQGGAAAMADPSVHAAQGRYVQDDAVAAQVQERMSLQRILVSESSPTLRPLSTPPITVVVTASHNDDAMPIRRSHSMANMVDGAQTPTPVTDSDDESPFPSRSVSPSGAASSFTDERSLPDSVEVPGGTAVFKPPNSYSSLIESAILSSPTRRLLLSEIYDWIQENHMYYRYCNINWKNAIRHNLSLHDYFVKIPRIGLGKGNYWTIDPTQSGTLSSSRRRKAAERKMRQQLESPGGRDPSPGSQMNGFGPPPWQGLPYGVPLGSPTGSPVSQSPSLMSLPSPVRPQHNRSRSAEVYVSGGGGFGLPLPAWAPPSTSLSAPQIQMMGPQGMQQMSMMGSQGSALPLPQTPPFMPHNLRIERARRRYSGSLR